MEAPTDDRFAHYARGWRERHALQQERRLARAREARAAARACARVLAERFGARRVWLFGSALDPSRFDERSDIDLAAEGVRGWLTALAACEACSPGFEVMVVPLEDAADSLHARILREGELLHGPAA